MGKAWTEQDVKQAFEEDENCSVSIRTAAKKYGMAEGILRRRIKKKIDLLLVQADLQRLIKMSQRNLQNSYLLCVN